MQYSLKGETENDAEIYEVAYDSIDIAVRNFVKTTKHINTIIQEKAKEFDGVHCIFCGSIIEPRERVTKLGKSYCKACAERLFRF